jgi:hypothetical protein
MNRITDGRAIPAQIKVESQVGFESQTLFGDRSTDISHLPSAFRPGEPRSVGGVFVVPVMTIPL